MPPQLSEQAQVELTGGVPFISDDQLARALEAVGVTGETADAIAAENAQARLDGLRTAMAVLALLALAALFLTHGLPTRQPGAEVRSPPT